MNWIPIEILLVQVIRAESLLQAQKNKWFYCKAVSFGAI
jgi:hypothetical protein